MPKLIIGIAIYILALLTTFSLFSNLNLYLNTSPSLPIGIWVQSENSLIKGAYIIFRHPNNKNRLLKKVHKISKNQVFAIGTHPNSYDSRHFGKIDINKIISTVEPLITIGGKL